MVRYIYCADGYDDSDSLSHAINLGGLVKGLKNREWKNHKWVARKRGKNGKWIYDYGDGFPDEKTGEKKTKAPFKRTLKDGSERGYRITSGDGKRVRSFKDLRADGNDRNYVVSNGRKVRKAEDGTAYTKVNNKFIFGDDDREASRKAAGYENKRKRQNNRSKRNKIY